MTRQQNHKNDKETKMQDMTNITNKVSEEFLSMLRAKVQEEITKKVQEYKSKISKTRNTNPSNSVIENFNIGDEFSITTSSDSDKER